MKNGHAGLDCLITSQNDTAPKQIAALDLVVARLITSQNDTAPKLFSILALRDRV